MGQHLATRKRLARHQRHLEQRAQGIHTKSMSDEHETLDVYPEESETVRIERLNSEHYLFKSLFGTNHFAPIDKHLSIALDVGTATGVWLIEMAQQFPTCQWYGIDVNTEAMPLQVKPTNTYFYNANILNRLSYPDGHFDYVHDRYLMGFIPRGLWPTAIKEMVRLTKPGGWIEFVETMGQIDGLDYGTCSSEQSIASSSQSLPYGHLNYSTTSKEYRDRYVHTERLREFITAIGNASNVDYEESVRELLNLQSYGITNVKAGWFDLPLGGPDVQWKLIQGNRVSEDGHGVHPVHVPETTGIEKGDVGILAELILEHIAEFYGKVKPAITQMFGISGTEFDQVMEGWKKEMEVYGGRMRVFVTYGIKPVV